MSGATPMVTNVRVTVGGKLVVDEVAHNDTILGECFRIVGRFAPLVSSQGPIMLTAERNGVTRMAFYFKE